MMGKSGITERTSRVAVSVVIPVYNVEKYLDETIQSVLKQELQDFEIILVNDGSTDSSAAICQKYASLDPRIYFFDQENAGVSVARNNGLSHAVGDYVYFLDSDDTIDSAFLLESLQLATQKKLDLVVLGEPYCSRAPRLAAVPTCGLLIKKTLLDTYPDIRFPEGIQPCEDGLFSHRLFLMTDKIGFNPAAVYFYRQHENQNHTQINRQTNRLLKQIPIWLELLKVFYKEHDLFASKGLKLALFVEHEPFEFRYLKMAFNDLEKEELFKLLQNFMQEYVSPHLTKIDKEILTVPFSYFLEARDHRDFDEFYAGYCKKRAEQLRRGLFWVRFIPVAGLRRKVRQKIRNKYLDV
ncbi:glycosyltransferase family 2 protein [Sphingobacterium sp. UBA5996]|uniref:glycosyltransferase family 2 protein n=1 Tax=Sphingobacterium sp. UBA5996 TaxID=1947505 RepID=UPI0025D69ACB|nr:glycosyltransferase family A protein [Sphingobacterium sp. UBA5996]